MRQLVRDLVIVGGLSAVGAPASFLWYSPRPSYLVTVGLVAMATAPLVALAYSRCVQDVRARPTIMLTTVAVLLGLLWGLVVGFVGGFAEPRFMEYSVVLAGISGALQLGWLGPWLIRRAAEGRRTWPLLGGAVVAAPLLGNVSYALLGLVERWPRVLG